MATTVSHSFGDTFNVYDYVTQERVGEISLMSDGWAAYRAKGQGVECKRIDTFPDAEAAIRALDRKTKIKVMNRS